MCYIHSASTDPCDCEPRCVLCMERTGTEERPVIGATPYRNRWTKRLQMPLEDYCSECVQVWEEDMARHREMRNRLRRQRRNRAILRKFNETISRTACLFDLAAGMVKTA